VKIGISLGVTGRQVPAGGPGVDAYDAWLTRVEALGATPTVTTKTAVRTFLIGLHADGLLVPNQTGTNFLYHLCGTNGADSTANRYNQARVNLLQPGTLDATVNSANASGLADSGITGDGSMYWSTGVNPSTHFGSRLDDVALIAAITGTLDGNEIADIGNEGSHATVARWHAALDQTFYGVVNNQLLSSANASNAAGLFTTTSQGGTVRTYKGSTEQATAARTGNTLANQEILCFARTANLGGPMAISSRKYGAFGVMSGLTAGQMTSLYSRLQTLLAANGASI
jgi:hypothetical protein